MLDKRTKQILFIIFVSILFAALLLNFHRLGRLFGLLWELVLPVAVGGIIAFFLNVPMKGFERLLLRLFARARRRPPLAALRAASLVLTLLAIVLVLALVFTLVIPELVESIVSIYNIVRRELPGWIAWLGEQGFDTKWLNQQLEKLDMSQLVTNLTSGAGSLLSWATSFAAGAVGAVFTGVLSFILALYFLSNRRSLSRLGRRLTLAYLPPKAAAVVLRVARLMNATFSKFLSGQGVEAVILGSLLFLAFSLCRLPYASLIAVLTAVCSFIPYFGAYFSCAVGAVLTLMVSPIKALLCVVVFLAVQFCEGQFIYPRVVGGSVGLPAMWTLVAALLGGNFFGILGMIFFIPLTAVIYQLLGEDVARRLKTRGIGE